MMRKAGKLRGIKELKWVYIHFSYTGWFFELTFPNVSTKKKISNQPIQAAVSENHITIKKGPDWLLSNFLFGTEIGEGQLQKPP